ncbi:hypothetical protein N7471_011111 [Penicillium samsonianum]|uniref:uncharacterized protein n=1 Tax=Penicillium samsonianum TaxID=1882272 RepID=UPI00254789A7|nr:uncharacterized protein N7471_011111 [Penicillium samsonianum]KAJ6123794.1 hypothetical protein N7471_011111 [Penicillium samsonianum]
MRKATSRVLLNVPVPTPHIDAYVGHTALEDDCTKDWCFGLVAVAHFMLSDSRGRRFVTDEAIDVEYRLEAETENYTDAIIMDFGAITMFLGDK